MDDQTHRSRSDARVRRLAFLFLPVALLVATATSGFVLWGEWRPWEPKTFDVPGERCLDVSVSPDQEAPAIAIVKEATRYFTWDMTRNEELTTLALGSLDSPLFLNAEGSRLVVEKWNGGFEIRDAQSGEVLHDLDVERGIGRSEVSPGRGVLVCATGYGFKGGFIFDGPVHAWHIGTGQRILRFDDGAGYNKQKLGFSPNGDQLVIAATFPQPARLWVFDLHTGQLVREWTDPPADFFPGPNSGIGLGHEGEVVLSRAQDGEQHVALWDRRGSMVWNLRHGRFSGGYPPRDDISSLFVFPDGQRLCLRQLNGTIRIRDMGNGSLLTELEVGEGRTRPYGDDLMIHVGRDGSVAFWHRRRPEWWWGALWLPAFWTTCILALLLVCSVIAVWRRRRGNARERVS